VEVLAGRLAHLADERVRFFRLLIEHEAQGHPHKSSARTLPFA
jgi:hypothetical protein